MHAKFEVGLWSCIYARNFKKTVAIKTRTILAITLRLEAQNYHNNMLHDATVAFQSQCYEFKQRKNRLFVFKNQYTGTASALIRAVKSRMYALRNKCMQGYYVHENCRAIDLPFFPDQ